MEELFPHGVKLASWDHYEPRCLHGFSLSLSTHSVLACDIGSMDLGYQMFQREKKGRDANMAKKQTAGQDRLGSLAPKFAELNDDVLFGEVWSREDKLSARDRSMITIAALFSAGLYPQLKSHLALGKEHGITKEEAVEIVTQLAFYCGWPKAWSAFPLIQEVYGEE